MTFSTAALVTGAGVVTSAGVGKDEFWAAMQRGQAMPTRAQDPHARMPLPLMYRIRGELPNTSSPPAGRAARIACIAVHEALEDAGLDLAALPGASRVGFLVGTGMGSSDLAENAGADGQDLPDSPYTLVTEVAGWLGSLDHVSSVSNACAASGYAVAMAADMVRAGELDVAIAGGTEAYSRVALGCFNRLGAVDPERCRPFDAQRRGTVFGEGAGFVVIESLDHARGRGVHPELALTGSAYSCDAHHLTAPQESGEEIIRAMQGALRRAGRTGSQLGCVVPHGTGTELNDTTESMALAEVLGDQVGDVPLYSLKSLIGHTGGAAGALSCVAAVLIVRNSEVPASVPVHDLDQRCPVLLPTGSTQLRAPHVLVNAYAFGGNNVSLVLSRVAA